MGPDWRGVDWADSASPCPSASTSPAPKSSDSRMIDEYDMRMSLWPISVAMFSSAPWMTLTVTGVHPAVGAAVAATGRHVGSAVSARAASGAAAAVAVRRWVVVGRSLMAIPRW